MLRTQTLLVAFLLLLSLLVPGCSPAQPPREIDLAELHDAVKAAYGEDYFADMPMEREMFIEYFKLPGDKVEAFIAEIPMLSMSVDTFVAVKATAGQGEALETALLAHRTYLIEESFQYPMNMPKVKASQVVRHGDYVFFLMLGAFNPDMEADEEAQLEYAREQVKKAVDAVDGFFA